MAYYSLGKPIHSHLQPENKEAPKDVLTEDEVELLTSPLELATYKSAITEAMFKGTKRNIESEDNQNTEAE